MEANRSLGKLEALAERPLTVDPALIDKLNIIIEKLPTAQPALEKQGSLDNLPLQMGGWTGVRAESTDKLAEALNKFPQVKGPFFVYTVDQATADKLIRELKE